jgi:thymidylate synthase
MDSASTAAVSHSFRILAVTQGVWGERIATHLAAAAPDDWRVESWRAPRALPPVIDDPDDTLPAELPVADLLLALGETPALAQLIPDLARRCGARAVIAPIDRNESFPPGLVRQVASWLDGLRITVVFPKPFCSLTESTVDVGRHTRDYEDPLIRRFASHFGRPQFQAEVYAGRITRLVVLRDSACGCARHVAEGLAGTPVDEAVEAAGMLHHHFPCLASMNQDTDYHDTLMHVSGHLIQDSLRDEICEYLTPIPFWRPDGRLEPSGDRPGSAAGEPGT